MEFTRITIDPEIMAGVPTIRGLRIPVATVLIMLSDGMTAQEICSELPDLQIEDVSEALKYAAIAIRDGDLQLLSA